MDLHSLRSFLKRRRFSVGGKLGSMLQSIFRGVKAGTAELKTSRVEGFREEKGFGLSRAFLTGRVRITAACRKESNFQ